jgi:pSer/pThr/pTyr-binding forkhead associated (FHA) protein
MPQTGDTETEERSSAPRLWVPREPHLFVVIEGDEPSAGGMRGSLEGIDEVTIGRSTDRVMDRQAGRLTVGVPDRSASNVHARLVRAPEGWRVEDLGSTNGTFVNGTRTAGERLIDGDFFEVGRTVFRLRLGLPTPEGTPRSLRAADVSSPRLGVPTLIPALAGELVPTERVARSELPVLLLGETGTGKELLARAVHEVSKRPGELVSINCGALPETLVEAMLFGHCKGAFSGAVNSSVGFVRSADKGTLFLDEIGDLPHAAQTVLLRVLQEGEVVPLGATRPVKVDVRVIAATHKSIDTMVERGSFRRDLYARLQGFTHRLWPMRERREDVGMLTMNILRQERKASAPVRMTREAARLFAAYEWPLNVRELKLALTRARSIAAESRIAPEHLPPHMVAPPPVRQAPPEGLAASEDDAELRASLVSLLRKERGNVSAVARSMKKAPMQIYRWMQRLGIEPRRFR